MKIWTRIRNRKHDRTYVSITLAIIITALSLVAALGSPSVGILNYTAPYSFIERVSLGIVAALFMLLYLFYAKIRPLQTSSVHSSLTQLPPGRAIDLQQRVGRTRPVTSLEAQIFALAITNPQLFRPRVTEVYEPARRTVNQEVTIDIQLPSVLFAEDATREANAVAGMKATTGSEGRESPQILSIPFPVVVPIKGELNDDLQIFGVGDARLAAYSYSEYLELVAGVLRLLLLKACATEKDEKLHPAVAKAELIALRCMMQRGVQDSSAVMRAVIAILNLKDVNLSATPGEIRRPNSQIINLIAEVVRQLANRYAIVASMECNADYRSVIRYRRIVVPGLKLSRPKRRSLASWAKERLAILLGARPVSVTIPLATAATCQSYHLVARCPDGLYLHKQRLHGLQEYLNADKERREALREKNRADVSIPPYYHLRSRLGQPYAHFYSRYLMEPRTAIKGATRGEKAAGQMTSTSETIAEFPSAEFAFDEVPPGSLFRAVLAALSAFSLIWIVGFIASKGDDPGTDAPAVLLAFPAVLAGWIGVDAMPRRLLEGTLTARLSLLVTAVCAVAGSALFMIYHAKVPILHGSIPFPVTVTFLGLGEGSWGILAAVSLANAVYTVYRWLKHTWEYKWLCARPSPLESVIEGS
jgi:hypothetical protein